MPLYVHFVISRNFFYIRYTTTYKKLFLFSSLFLYLNLNLPTVIPISFAFLYESTFESVLN